MGWLELAALCTVCVHSAASSGGEAVAWLAMSKRTSKRRTKARRSKANHGRKPNAGRNS